ncbi:MAG: hypothetical protein R3A50_07810 [Saprospiraceae bacterium]
MKLEWIDEMRKTRRLKLSFTGYLTHYLIVLLLFIPFILVLFDFFRFYVLGSYDGVRTLQELLRATLPFAAIGVLFSFIQYRRLRFQIIETVLPREELREVIIKTAEELEWLPVINRADIILSKTNPSWWTGSWGEQITILFDKDKLLINSICDPEKKASVLSFGRNKRNVTKLAENIENASR